MSNNQRNNILLNQILEQIKNNSEVKQMLLSYLIDDITFNNNVNLKHYYYYDKTVFDKAVMALKLNRTLQIAKNNDLAVLKNENAKNISLLKHLQVKIPGLLMNTSEYGVDFVNIAMDAGFKHFIGINANNEEVLIKKKNTLLVQNILDNMNNEKYDDTIFKFNYHNIEAKSNDLLIKDFTFNSIMTKPAFFDPKIQHHLVSSMEHRYMDPTITNLNYDGFIRSYHLKRDLQQCIAFVFLNDEYGLKLQSIVDIMSQLFKNTELYLYELDQIGLSDFYMKLELWMLYKDIKWLFKTMYGWENSDRPLTLLYLAQNYASISITDFYRFIKKRLMYVFTIYTDIRNIVKEALKNDLQQLKTSLSELNLTQRQKMLKDLMAREQILYKFKNTKSIKFTPTSVTTKMLTNTEFEEFFNKIIGSDKEFVDKLKELGNLIVDDDPNVQLTNDDYDKILNHTSDLNNNFSEFDKPWSLR